MSERRSQIILLCEDDAQEQVVCAYLRNCGLKAQPPYVISRNASREIHGGNVGWVLQTFPIELKACRSRHTRTRTLLIVVVDADEKTVKERRMELVGLEADDPVVTLIPKRHIETWIRCVLRGDANEEADYKRPAPRKEEIRSAAEIIHGWARNSPAPSPECVPSLLESLPSWRAIG